MRIVVLVGTVAVVGASLAGLTLAACGPPDSAFASGVLDGGTSGSSGDLDGGGDDADGGIAPLTTLRAGQVELVGVTADDQAIYRVGDRAGPTSLEAIPIAGGAPTVLATGLVPADRVVVQGGAAAWYTAVDGAGIGTVNLWTKASGVKPALSTSSHVGLFAASPDGTRVAFSVAATATSTALAVTNAATPSAAATLSGPNEVNLAATANCAPMLAFAGAALFGAYCNGTLAGANAARLVTVSAAGDVTRLDESDINAAGTLRPFFSIDKAGGALFVITVSGSEGLIIRLGTPGNIKLELDTQDGFMRDDGTAVVYRLGTGEPLKRATVVEPPVITTLVAGNVKDVLGVSKGGARVLFHTLEPATTEGLVDLQTIDTRPETPPPMSTIVPTAVALPLGFSPDGDNVLYFSDVSAGGTNLKIRPSIGGIEQLIAADVGLALIAAEGTGVVLATDEVVFEKETLLTLGFVDTLMGGPPRHIADRVPLGAYAFKGKKFLFTRRSNTTPGLFVVDLP